MDPPRRTGSGGKPVVCRLSIDDGDESPEALLLAGCGKDTTELPEGPETPATGGDAIVCRLSIGNEAPDPTDETRTAYGPLQDGYYPIYWRNADRVGIICPQTTPQWAEVEVSVSGATESEADLSDTGMVWGEGLHDFYAFYPSGAIRANAGSIVVAAVPAVQTCNNGECNMQYACMSACAEDVAQGEVVSFAFRPLMTTVAVSVGFSETVEVQKLVLSSANDAVAGQFTHDIAANVSTVDPDRRSNVLALHLTTGDAPYIRINAGSKIVVTAFMLPQDIRGLTLTAVTTQGRTYSYTTPATLRAGHRYSFSVGDMPAQAQHIASDRSDWMKYLPDNAFLSQISVTKAQELSIEEQLAAGVRMFDLRPCASSASVKDLPIHHGISVLGDPARGGYTPGASVGRSCRPSCSRTCSTASCVSWRSIRARRCSCI